MRSKSACGDSFLRIESCFCLCSGRLLGKKNGIPLYPNLVNLKSNTMKNTHANIEIIYDTRKFFLVKGLLF